MVVASPEYSIDVLADLPPSVVISDPGRDAQASAIEELFVEAKADDDYGIEDLSLVYSVNGEAREHRPALQWGWVPPDGGDGRAHPLPGGVGAGAGDVISYYAVAQGQSERPGEGSV